MKIVVIGAGSVGSHVAFRLCDQGADVELLDASRPGSGTTSSSIAWLSSYPQMSWEEDQGRAALRGRVHQLFNELQEQVPGEYVHWSETLMWVRPHEREEYRRRAEVVRGKGVEILELTAAEARERQPRLVLPDDEIVFVETGSGWVDGPAIVRALGAELVRRGGLLRQDAPVVALERQHGKVTAAVLGDGTTVHGDAFVNAAGAWGSHVAAMADLAIPVDLVPGWVVYSQPVDGFAQVLNTPDWVARPDPSGGIAIHWRGGPMTSKHGGNARSAQDVINDVARTIRGLEGTAPARTSVGIRPVPPGGPVVGSVPWLDNFYLALSHGGIGWGPMWGWMAARELLHGEDVPELSAMRPERFYLEAIGMGRFADDAEQEVARAH